MKLVITESQLKKIVKNKVNKSMNENIDGPTNKVILVSVESEDGNYEVDFDVLKVFSNSGAARNYTNYLRDRHKGGTPFMQEFEVLNAFDYEEMDDDGDESEYNEGIIDSIKSGYNTVSNAVQSGVNTLKGGVEKVVGGIADVMRPKDFDAKIANIAALIRNPPTKANVNGVIIYKINNPQNKLHNMDMEKYFKDNKIYADHVLAASTFIKQGKPLTGVQYASLFRTPQGRSYANRKSLPWLFK